MNTADGADPRNSPTEDPLCAQASRQATESRKAPLTGTVCAFEHPRGPGDRELVRLAERQHGCLHRRQLLAGGVGRHGISGRIGRRQLAPVLSDVFLFGQRDPDPQTRTMAVALHLRGDGVISVESATWIWELTDLTPDTIHATLVGRSTHTLPGVTLHRVATIDRSDIRWRKGIPVTSPARSLADFAASEASLPRIESALAMLRHREASADRQLTATLDHLPANHRGAAVLRRLMAAPPGDLSLTRSIYERRLRRLLTEAGLAQPVSNQHIAGSERDLVWAQARLIVEFDGFEFHRLKFREDRARDATAVAAGWRVMRITKDRIDSEPYAVVAEIAAALAVAQAA